MPKECKNKSKHNQNEKYIETAFTMYFDLQCLIKQACDINNTSALKVSKRIPSGYSILTHCLFDCTKNKYDYYRGKDFMVKFCEENMKDKIL